MSNFSVREDDFLSCCQEDCMNSLLTIYRYADLSLHKNLYMKIGFVSTSSKFDGISSLTYNKTPPTNASRSNL